jgi:LytS/YehU family sensor histidine kinase
VLQPLVENAVQHGALRRHGGGTVSLRARDEQGDLVVEVRNDGPAPVRESRDGGQGLDLVRQRLALAHPRAGVTLAREGGETVVRVRLPGREAA